MRKTILLHFLCMGIFSSAYALEVPSVRARVNDHASLLDASQAASVEQMLEAYEKKSGHQFAVLTVPSLEGDPIEDFSIRVVAAWKLGHANRDDGVLLLVAVKERAVRIEVGHGLEGAITDALSSRVIREVFVPAFKQGMYAQGITDSLQVLMHAASGENTGLPSQKKKAFPWPVLVVLLIFVLFHLASFNGRGGGGPFIMGGGGWGGGRGFGGGGFSGGGGSFGGGGSSGRW